MQSKNIWYQIALVAVIMALPLSCFAQLSFVNIVNKPQIPVETVPFEMIKYGLRFDNYNYGINNSNSPIPDRLYDDLQLTQYTHAEISGEDGTGHRVGTLFRKFSIPGRNNLLFAVEFSEAEWSSMALCVVNTSGMLLDTLEVHISYNSSSTNIIAVKQFRINAQTQIIVSSITPTSATPLVLFESLISFTGQRTDKTYTVNTQGQFVETAVQHFQPRTYTRAYLENRDINIWEGNETPL